MEEPTESIDDTATVLMHLAKPYRELVYNIGKRHPERQRPLRTAEQ